MFTQQALRRIAGLLALICVSTVRGEDAGLAPAGGGEVAQEAAPDKEVYYLGRPFPGEPVTGAYLKTQKLFDAYYEQQRYQEAHKALMKGLIWRGDKHAQYMLGVMYWNGEGVPKDRATGAAWFRLAAQRGNTRLMNHRDQAWTTLTPRQQQRAQAEFKEIREEYGDRAIIKMLVRRDGWNLNRSITAHATAKGGNLQMIDGSGITISGIEFASQKDAITHLRLEYLGGYVEYGELELIDGDTRAAAPVEKAEQSGD